VTKDDLQDERYLRAWAIEQVMGSALRQGVAAPQTLPDPIAWAQRIVDFVKGDGSAKGAA
jgi:hypothetical protein